MVQWALELLHNKIEFPPFQNEAEDTGSERVSQWQQWGKTNNTYEVFNPLILPKLTTELASVGRDSLHPLSPAVYSNTIFYPQKYTTLPLAWGQIGKEQIAEPNA